MNVLTILSTSQCFSHHIFRKSIQQQLGHQTTEPHLILHILCTRDAPTATRRCRVGTVPQYTAPCSHQWAPRVIQVCILQNLNESICYRLFPQHPVQYVQESKPAIAGYRQNVNNHHLSLSRVLSSTKRHLATMEFGVRCGCDHYGPSYLRATKCLIPDFTILQWVVACFYLP